MLIPDGLFDISILTDMCLVVFSSNMVLCHFHKCFFSNQGYFSAVSVSIFALPLAILVSVMSNPPPYCIMWPACRSYDHPDYWDHPAFHLDFQIIQLFTLISRSSSTPGYFCGCVDVHKKLAVSRCPKQLLPFGRWLLKVYSHVSNNVDPKISALLD